MKFLKEKLLLSEKGYSDLKKAIVACTLTNIALLLPAGVTTLLFWQLLNPFYGKDISWGNMWGLLIVGIIASLLVFLAARNDYRKTYLASYKEASNTRLRIAEHLRKLPMSFFNSRDLSDITTNMMADCASMESMLSSTIPPLIANVISVTLTCVCLAFFDWRMALALFATMPITFLIIWAGRNLQIRMFDRQVGIKLEASSQIQEYLEGIKIIKSCGLSGERFSTLNRALLAMKKVAIQAELVSGVLVQSAALILQASLGIAIFVGTVLITGGQIELLPLLVLLMFSTQLYGPILAILSQLTSLFHLGTVTKRMRMLLTTPAMEGNEQDVHTYDIELKNVTFAYAKEDVIKDVSLKIPSGSITALVGPSGSGKSTISKLIARFWDVQEGTVRIGGKNVRDYTADSVLEYISMVFQNVYLFHDSVENNIRFGRPEATREQVIAAAKRACCHDFILSLPDGYDTIIGEGGSTLSGGEKQRISIARAILKDAPIIILDEATSSVDPENEQALLSAIQELTKDKTLISIAHRLSTVRNADQIIVIDQGRIVQRGTHHELLQKEGIYQRFLTLRTAATGWQL